MEKKTFNLTLEVLNRFQKAGILRSIVLIGSWSVYFYKYYFKSKSYSSFIRTRDIDFLVQVPIKLNKKIDLFKLLEDLGFIEEFSRPKGYIKLTHPDLTVEFLVPEKGKESDKPYPLPQLGINAQALRYLDILSENTISIDVDGIQIILPHPAAYALHKFIIFKRRGNQDKRDRDLEGAIRVFHELIKNDGLTAIKQVFNSLHKKWQATVLKNLESVKEVEIINTLK